MPKQPFVLTWNIFTSVTALWSFKCTTISCDKSSETLCGVCCSDPVQRTGRVRLLEQLEQISVYACERYQRYMCFQRALSWSVQFHTEVWRCSFKTVSSCSSLTRPWILENYYWRSGKEAEECDAPVEGENNYILVFHFDPKPIGRIAKKGSTISPGFPATQTWAVAAYGTSYARHLGYDFFCVTASCLANTRRK